MGIKPHVEKLAKDLSGNGIRYAFGVAGGGPSLELITALENCGVKFYPVAHEASAALMAGACCRDGRTNAAAISIKGPGFINLMPGILSNAYENRPALTISEAYSPFAPSFNTHKRLDHKAVCYSIVKAFAAADNSGETVKELFEIAGEEAPSPVHLDLYAESAEKQGIIFGSHKENIESSRDEIGRALKLIEQSKKPAVVLGSLAIRKLNTIKWDSIGVPVATTAAAKGCIDEKSFYAAGVITGEVQELSPETTILSKADLIIAIGLRNTEMVRVKPFSAPLVSIDVVDSGFRNGFSAKCDLVVKDINLLISRIIPLFSEKKWGDGAVAEARDKIKKELFKYGWMPATVFAQLNIKKEKTDMTLILDTGIFGTVGETVWKAEKPVDFLGSSVGRFMGVSVPTAIGAAISNPERRIICVAGDGGIRPYLPEIKLAVQEKLPILFMLMSDGEYGTFSASGRLKGLSNRAFTVVNPSWYSVIEKIGCSSFLAQNLDEFNKLINNWIKNRAPSFVEMRFDPLKYSVMVQKLR